ncbi:MAG: Rrf2 family transcriptional regulator [Sulfurospirillaceae bacterium]|jgi:Rrf2 family protein|nr:Rrf2 family transcriptional regulator [Sulfurospirillaceae bacterium]MDY0238232.1 Rrf2 family transcriptional regulator [Campylobacterales bacterium]
MFFSKTAEHSIRILIYFVANEGGVFSAKTLHEALGIPYKYLTRLTTLLAKAGFLRSIKGRDGGFLLSKPAKEITLYEVVEAVEDTASYHSCVLGFKECDCENPCFLHHGWVDLREDLLSFLTKTTLEANFKDGKYFKI